MYLPLFSIEKFRELVKIYHPDNAETGDREKYEEIIEWRESQNPVKFNNTYDSVFFKRGHMTNIYLATKHNGEDIKRKILSEGKDKDGNIDKKLNLYGDIYFKESRHPAVNKHLGYIYSVLSNLTSDRLQTNLRNYFYRPVKICQTIRIVNGKRVSYSYFMYYAAKSFTIKDIKDIMGHVETKHIVWMFNRILEGLILLNDNSCSMNAALPEHFAFIPQNHGVYFLGSSYELKHKPNVVYPKGYLDKKLFGNDRVVYDTMMAGKALATICDDPDFKRFLENCNGMPDQIHDEWTKFWESRLERKWHDFVVPE